MIEYENLRDVNEQFFGDLTHNFNNVLNAGVFVHGSYVRRFEEAFAKYTGAELCIACGSGADAALLAIKSIDFEKGSEIILSSNSPVTSFLAIVYSDAVPVLIEPSLKTYNIDPDLIEEKITSKTIAILATHMFGKACDMEAIIRIAQNNNLKVIEDCSHSHGAKFKNKRTGSFGLTAFFGFEPEKIVGALGNAGAVLTSDKEIKDKIISLRNCKKNDGTRYDLANFNSCPNELQNGFLLSKLKRIDEIIEHKRKLANLYTMFLKDDFVKPFDDDDYYDVFFEYNIRHQQKNELKEYLFKNGVQTNIHQTLNPETHYALEKIDFHEFSTTEEINKTMLGLPISFAHTETDIFKIIEIMNKF